MSEWKQISLGNLVESISKRHAFNKDRLIFLNTSDIFNGKVLNNEYTDINTLPGQAKKSIQKNDILFSEIRPANRRFAYIDFESEDYVVSTKLMVLRPKNNDILPKYLYYFLTSEESLRHLQEVAESRSGTFPQITFSEVKEMVINLPPLKEQQRIVEVIDSLTEKIELNLKINETLEEMAMTLYKHWFVDFGPFQDGEFVESELGMIPKGWEIKKLSDIVEIRTTSINPSKTPGEFYYHYSIPAYDEGKLPSLNSAESIKSNKYLIETDTVLVSKLNPATPRIWTVYFKKESKNKQITSTEFIHYVPKQNINFAWLNCYLRSDDFQNEFKSNATGTTHSRQRVSPKVTKNFLVVIPPFDVMASFNNKVSSYFKLIDQNLKSITLLSETRDYLIPRLLSGEIDVSKAEKQVEEVL
ncbi:hypothetical protein A5418_01040 [Geobacillus subterraneus]|uniref:restriction endonuclease subunit S n=1 Tax=Geobacillus TaxID=129337 RepID=UPI0007BE967D|nr:MULTISPECIES: restriction endonuclease subunit S [Geobacillus]KZS26547.1 hypothetical protein A5418_01040 [Geobacillus subterraneus]